MAGGQRLVPARWPRQASRRRQGRAFWCQVVAGVAGKEEAVASADSPGFDGAPRPAQLEAAAAVFDMLSTPVRLHLMWLLCHGEHDVGWLAERVGTSVAAVSQQLGKLRLAGLVSARREGRYQIYTADDPHILMLVDQVFEHVAPEPPPGAADRSLASRLRRSRFGAGR
jgi:DNA-binding transcriptional ArsR family regulator